MGKGGAEAQESQVWRECHEQPSTFANGGRSAGHGSGNDADRERFLKLVKTVWQGIKKEVFFPKADWQCGQCPFLDHCKTW
jgi:hypothetical protein